MKKYINVENIVFFIAFLYISGATFITTSKLENYVVVISVLFTTTVMIKRNIGFDKSLLFIILYLIIISVISALYFNVPLDFWLLIGFNARIYLAYTIIKILDLKFFKIFDNWVYYFSIISIPLFFIQLINPYFFINNFSSFNLSNELRTSVNYYNFFFYTSHGGALDRNTGFAIEPGHFGYILTFVIYYNMITYDFKINRRLLLYLFVGLTTLSTTFYLCLVFLVGYYVYIKKQRILVFIVPFLMYGSILLFTLPFMGDKIDQTYEKAEYDVKYNTGQNRIGALIVGYQNIANYPFGYGVNVESRIKDEYGEVIVGPNSIAQFLVVWGIQWFFVLIVLFYKFDYTISSLLNLKYRFNIVFVFLILLQLFSNSIYRDVLIWIILFTPTIKLNNDLNVEK